MRNFLGIILVLGLVFSVPVATVLADEDDGNLGEPIIIDDTGKIVPYEIRLKKVAKRFEDSIDDAKEKRIEKACDSVRSRLSTATDGMQKFQEKHSNIHKKWVSRFGELSDKLENAGIDTTQLDEHIKQLEELVSSNANDFDHYISGLSDAGGVDCKEDAQAFYSALQAARASRELVLADTKEVIRIIKEDIKAELLKIRQQLASEAPALKVNSGEEGGE